MNASGTLAFVVECKNYKLNKHGQTLAVRQLNRNFPLVVEFLKRFRWGEQDILIKKVLVAKRFHHFSDGFLHYTVKEIIKDIKERLEDEARGS